MNLTEQDNTMSADDEQRLAILNRLNTGGYLDWGGVEQANREMAIVIANEKRELLDRLQQSFDQHTTPESKNLLTRSYIDHTMQFERATLRGDN